MERSPVTSTNLQSVGYDKDAKVLEIAFHKGGICHYINVPEETYKGLMNARLKGTFHNVNIKNSFQYRRGSYHKVDKEIKV